MGLVETIVESGRGVLDDEYRYRPFPGDDQGACFGPNARLVGDMIRQDAERILQLNRQIKALEDEMARIAANSAIACQLASIPGYGSVRSAELAGEIGT